MQATLTTDKLLNVGYDREPYAITLSAPGAGKATASWVAYDWRGRPVDDGWFTLRGDGTRAWSWTPPALGLFALVASVWPGDGSVRTPGTELATPCAFLTATPDYTSAGLPRLGGDNLPFYKFNDPAIEASAGVGICRIKHDEPDAIARFQAARKHGITCVCLVEDKEHLTPAVATDVATRLGPYIDGVEAGNEPDTWGLPSWGAWMAIQRPFYAAVKAARPSLPVLGPCLNMLSPRNFDEFLKVGGLSVVDIVTQHPYNWDTDTKYNVYVYLLGEIKKRCAGKPLLLTERAVPGVRYTGDQNWGNYIWMGSVQAVRLMQIMQAADAAGIGARNVMPYQDYQQGDWTVGAHQVAEAGCHPSLSALRVRAAMTAGAKTVTPLAFGPTGDRLLCGSRHEMEDGSSVLLLMSQGAESVPFSLPTTGPDMQVFDAFGNPRDLRPMEAGLLPLYIKIPAGMSLPLGPVAPIDFGTNIAPSAKISYTANNPLPNYGPLANLTDGQSGGFFQESPYSVPWSGEMRPGHEEALQFDLPAEAEITGLIVDSQRGDNAYPALLTFDAQWQDGDGAWHTLGRFGEPAQPSVKAATPGCSILSWYANQAVHAEQFPKIVGVHCVRLIPRETTRGVFGDEAANAVSLQQFKPYLALNEVSIYGTLKEAAKPAPAPADVPSAPSVYIPIPTGTGLRINAGGGQYSAKAGVLFAADSGSVGYSSVYATPLPITGTDDPALYQSCRYSPNFAYNLPVTPGQAYTLRLHFAEVYYPGPGYRVQNVLVDGKPVLTNFDITAAAQGHHKALVKEFPVTPAGSVLPVAFVAVVEQALVCALELLPVLSPAAAPAAPAPLPATSVKPA